jgi:hypothetical protein
MYVDKHAVLECPGPVCRILQVADLHTDEEERLNERTRHDIRVMAEGHRPHLLVALGDIWCGDAHPEAAPMWRTRDLDFFASLRVPWTLIWGNHDYRESDAEVLRETRRRPHALAPEGNGHGAFRIEVHAKGSQKAAWDLFFLHSGEAWRVPRDTAWFETEVARVNAARGEIRPAVCYFHIPTGNYQRAIDEGRTIGFGNESVLGWGDDKGEVSELLIAAGRDQGARVGNIRLCFCGHSHRNDFYFEEEGVRFAYNRATGHGGYGAEDLPKGATLLELDLSSEGFQHRTIFAEKTDEK